MENRDTQGYSCRKANVKVRGITEIDGVLIMDTQTWKTTISPKVCAPSQFADTHAQLLRSYLLDEQVTVDKIVNLVLYRVLAHISLLKVQAAIEWSNSLQESRTESGSQQVQ